MATFLGVHGTKDSGPPPGMSPDMLKQGWEDYKAASTKMGCKPLHVHANFEKGRAFCVTEANSADEVQKAHDEAHVPLEEIIEVETLE
jgi:hypothetical protein